MNKFNKTKINIAILALIVVISTSVSAEQDLSSKIDFGGNQNVQRLAQENLEAKKAEEVKKADPYEGMTKFQVKEGVVGHLNQYESDLISQKEHVLLKALHERQQLEELRKLLSDYEKKQSYKDTVEKEVPLTSEQIMQLRMMLRDAEKAKNTPLLGSVKNEIRTIDIDVDANEPIKLNVAAGYASSIVFFDHTGVSWPIDGDIIGNKAAFDSKPGSKSHIAVFENIKQFSESNALINLVGLDVPIVISLVGNDKVVDSRLSIRLPKFGPNAQNQVYRSSELQEISPEALKVLDGDKLPNGKRYRLNGVSGEVTYANGTLYIRTRANLISPPWKNMVNSSTGYKVYELPPVDNLLFTVDGEMVDATIEKGFEVKIEQRKSIFSE